MKRCSICDSEAHAPGCPRIEVELVKDLRFREEILVRIKGDDLMVITPAELRALREAIERWEKNQ